MTGDSAVRALLKVAALILLAPNASSAQESQLRGRVVSESATPIASATVTLTAVGYTVRTDSLGAFTLNGTPGSTLNLVFRAAGFRPDSASIVLSRGRAVTKEFVLVAMTTPVAEANPSDRMLRGRVTDTDGAPLSFANIQLNGSSRFIADDSGRFTLPFGGDGRIWLLVRRIGFDPAELRLDSMPDTALRVTMTPLARVLPEQRVTGRAAIRSLDLHGFYQRTKEYERGGNRGYFVTPEELELRRPNNLTAAVQYLPFVRVRPIPGTLDLWQNLRIEDTKRCPMTVYLDRIRIQPTRSHGQLEDERVNLLALPSHLAGIEVYPGTVGAPPAYQAVYGTCGVVLVWTK